MEKAARELEFEYAALIRDRLGRLEALQRELIAFKGRVEGLTFVYRVPAFKGNDRLYLIRKGIVEEDISFPRGRARRARAARKVMEVFSRPPVEPGSLTQEKAAEILLVARWFRLRHRELRRTQAPEEWLEGSLPATPAPLRGTGTLTSLPVPSSG